MNELEELQTQHYLGRAKNAVQSYLVRKLLIPKVYLDAEWNGQKLDVLAIDRAGSGDVHGVKLIRWEPGLRDNRGFSAYLDSAVLNAIQWFSSFPGQFQYLAVVCCESDKQRWLPAKSIAHHALSSDGIGRIGILYVDVAGDDAEAEIILKPERFRSSKQIVELTDQFVAEHTANWEVRE